MYYIITKNDMVQGLHCAEDDPIRAAAQSGLRALSSEVIRLAIAPMRSVARGVSLDDRQITHRTRRTGRGSVRDGYRSAQVRATRATAAPTKCA